MGSKNNTAIFIDKLKGVMFNDRHMKSGDIRRIVLRHRKLEDYNPPRNFGYDVEVKPVYDKDGVSFYINKRGVAPERAIMFIHGGGFCMEINKKQWEFAAKLAAGTGYEVVVPIYPLTPEHSGMECFAMLKNAYDKMNGRKQYEQVTILGEECGGGMALSLALMQWKHGGRRPDKLVLLSPFVDAGYKDRRLEKMVIDADANYHGYYHTYGIKSFLREYWIGNDVMDPDLLCPLESDFTDICDEIDIFSVAQDMLNGYSTALYEKLKNYQTIVHYYVFNNIVHDYVEHQEIPECRMITKKLINCITEKNQSIPYDVKQSVWVRALLSERYSKIYSDQTSVRLADKFHVEYKDFNSGISLYDKAMCFGRILAMDEEVRCFINRYPDGVIVNVGSEMDTMFERLDNTRIKWYNVDLPERIAIRHKYLGTRDREFNIDKSILDFSWLDQIKYKKGLGILFVCSDVMKLFDEKKLKRLLAEIYKRYQGAEVVFDIKNSVGKRKWNAERIIKSENKPRIRISIDNCISNLYDWNPRYKIIKDIPLLDEKMAEQLFGRDVTRKLRHKIKRKYDKLIHLRLGRERYIETD